MAMATMEQLEKHVSEAWSELYYELLLRDVVMILYKRLDYGKRAKGGILCQSA